jgi:hypothetical protein
LSLSRLDRPYLFSVTYLTYHHHQPFSFHSRNIFDIPYHNSPFVELSNRAIGVSLSNMAQGERVVITANEQQFLDKLPSMVVPTNLNGVYSNPPLPDDFDAHKASQADLTRHGLLFHKPNASHPPEVHQVYNRFFSRQWLAKDRIVPHSEPNIGVTHLLKGDIKKQADSSWTNYSWAGAGQNTKTYKGVIGTWTVPTVSIAPEPLGFEGGWLSSSWVGIDGMEIPNPFQSTDVLQAGITQRVSPTGIAEYYAWYEWYVHWTPGSGLPGYVFETPISNFPVKPGDEITCLVTYYQQTSGVIYIANNTNGAHFGITLAPPAAPGQPSPASFNGSSVEWIMEDPDGSKDHSSLPKFTPVTFTECVACLSDGTNIGPEMAIP